MGGKSFLQKKLNERGGKSELQLICKDERISSSLTLQLERIIKLMEVLKIRISEIS